MAKPKVKFYAVAKGRAPGIYETWEETKGQVNGFKGLSKRDLIHGQRRKPG